MITSSSASSLERQYDVAKIDYGLKCGHALVLVGGPTRYFILLDQKYETVKMDIRRATAPKIATPYT